MRKVLSFVLVLSLVLGSFGMAFAATATTPVKKTLSDIDGLACEDAVRVLTSLDVVSGYEDGSYKPTQTVTRAEMASLIIKALGLKETDAVPKFADSKTHWAKGFIAYANTLGIISGRSETVFDPDATVTYDEATTMLVKALGYTDEALNGTYPASFVSRARVLGILDGVQTGSGGANRGDIAIMLYQTLDQAIGKVDKDGNFQETVIEWNKGTGTNASTPKKYDTMLDRLGASLRDDTTYAVDNNDSSFILTRTDADDALINVYPYIGAVVSAYENKDGDIIAIKEVFSTFINGTFDKVDNVITDTTGKEYDVVNDALKMMYKDADNRTTSAAALKNGIVKANTVSGNDDTYYTFAVDLSGKNVKEVYSFNQWTIDNGMMVESDDIEDIEDNKLLGYEFPEDDNGDIDMDAFELVGVNSLDDIKADMVVYVYSKNGKDDKEITRVAVGTETASGVVTKLSKDGDKVTIDGKDYKFAAGDSKAGELDNNGAGKLDDPATVGDIDVDDEVKLYLDAYGFIYDYDKIAGDADKYAVVLDAGQSGGFKSDYQVELFLADGTTKIFTIDNDDEDLPVGSASASKSLTVTDTSISSPKAVVIGPGSLIKYGLNKSGEINSMELYEAVDNKLGSDKAVTKKGLWDSKEIKSDAVIFTYDGTRGDATDMSDDDNYDVATLETVLDSDPVGGTYFLNSKGQIEGAVLMGFETTKDVFGVVTDWTKSSDDLFNVSMYVDGEVKEYKADVSRNDLSGLDEVGKAYKLKFNASGEITSLLIETSNDFKKKAGFYEGKFVSGSSISISGNRVTFENANSTKGGGMDVDGNAGATFPADGIFNLDSSVDVYLIDKNGDWSVEKKAELKNVEDGDIITFYNTDDDDYGVTTIVVIDKYTNR